MGFTTFVDMLRNAAWRKPKQTFITWVDRNRNITYEEGNLISDKIAAGLAELGVKQGDRVGIFAHNGLDYVLAMFGIWKLGAISSHISVLQAENLPYFVNDSTPKVLIYTGDMHEVVTNNLPQMPSVKHIVCYEGAKDGAIGWDEMIQKAGEPPKVVVDAMHGAHLSYTSGSSGPSKGVLLAHGFTARATHCIAERLGLTSEDVTLGPTSLSSSFQLVANLLSGVHRCCHIGIMTRWNPDAAWEDMEKRKVSLLVGNPLLFNDLLIEMRQRGAKPANLRMALSGGAPMPPDVKKGFLDEWGVYVIESYGQSELGGFVAMGYPKHEPPNRQFTIGPGLPDREVIIADEQDNQVPIGEIGQMLIRDGVMLGYWNRPEKTEEALRGGWLHTGDMGRMDEEGYISMVGRWSERIVCEGKIIYPRVMEESLLRHPSVHYAAVIGKPHPTKGEIPKGIVELFADKKVTPEELLAHCQKDLGKENSPYEVEIIPEMPMTPTGKIGRADLQRRERGEQAL